MKKKWLIVGLILGFACIHTGAVNANTAKFTINVYLSSQGENVNAFGGTLRYPNAWQVEEVTLRGTEFLYWIQAPELKNFGELNFSGIFPGGVQSLATSNDQLALFSLEIVGSQEEVETLRFEETEFFLNHPTALPAEKASFAYTLDSNDFFAELSTAGLFSGINYSFEKDPVTQKDTLVVESYRGNLASYDFFTKEGNLWTGEWNQMDGIQELQSASQTVVLNIRTPSNEEYEMVLRRSLLDHLVWFLGVGGGGTLLFYLFYLAVKILEFKPEDIRGA